jgi:ferredoxin
MHHAFNTTTSKQIVLVYLVVYDSLKETAQVITMCYKVTIRNSGECFCVETGESILNAARRQGVTLPYGCDNGVCGACIYRIIEGRVEYPDGQPFALFDEDMEAGKGLCCVGYPDSDMLIELEYSNVGFEPWV